jgi:D-sedoheptulose 7-phosphate isomerase
MPNQTEVGADDLESAVEERLLRRNGIFESFFAEESHPLALLCQEMSERFLKGGRILAFGRGPYATDAQHVSVEFVHPIIAGKRVLPALDLSLLFRPWLDAILRPEDIVVGIGPPQGDVMIEDALAMAHAKGALTLGLPGVGGSYVLEPPTQDPFLHQELIEILYHTLWETVHVFFEHREVGGDAVVDQVAASIQMKAQEDARLRVEVARKESGKMVKAARAIYDRVTRGGKVIFFGNGGSATDANDWAIDCVLPPTGYKPIPAISLALEPASLTAIANDLGVQHIFVRQLIAHARPEDIAIGISTSGGSRNLVLALEEARKRGLLTLAWLGYDGGEILRRGLADIPLVVHSDYIPRIQEVHASIYHIIREILEGLGRGQV